MTKFCYLQINGDATQLTSSMSLVSRKPLTKAESLSYPPVIFHGPVRINNQSSVNLLALVSWNSVASHVCIAWKSKVTVTEKSAAFDVFLSVEQEQEQG